MPSARYKATIQAPYENVYGLLVDKVDNPRKYVGAVTHSSILERGDGYVVREMFQPVPVEMTIREKIFDVPVPGGRDFVFEQIDNVRYTGSFHNVLTRVEGRDDQVELEYVMDWRPHPGTQDEMSDGAAQKMVQAGVHHMKELAEHPVEVPDWVRTFFAAVDSLDADALGALLSEDCRFRVANGPEIVGRDNIVQASRGVTKVFAAMQHDYVDVYGDESRAYADCFVDYTTHDGKKFLIPFLTRLERSGEKVSAVMAYGDMSPVRYGWS
jgi:ketosteroid isomerase-like protein